MTNKISKLFIVTIALIAAIMVIIPLSSCSESKTAFDKYYGAVYNRGGSAARTENTLYAYAYAIENGATCIQADMQMTKDGVIVLNHDPFLNSAYVKDQNGNYVKEKQVDIRTITYNELQKYTIGPVDKNNKYYQNNPIPEKEVTAKVPTLEELFQLVANSKNKDVMINLEAKLYCDPSTGAYYTNNVDKDKFVHTFYDVVKSNKMEKRVILSSYDWSIFPIINELDDNILTGAIWRITPSEDIGIGNLWFSKEEASPWLNGNNVHAFDEGIVGIAFALDCDYIFPEKDSYASSQVDEAHRWGLKVITWTLNTEAEMNHAWDMGVDGIMSDNGPLLRSFLEDKEASLMKPTPFNSEYHID